MALEDQVQPVVTVAAFDPMRDQVIVLKRSDEAKNHPGLYETIGGKVEPGDQSSKDRLILEVSQETAGNIDHNATHFETFGIARSSRSHLLVSRYVSPLIPGSKLSIPPEEANEHPSFRFVSSENFHTLDYVPEVREFLARLFEEYKRTGTLLSTLKQPVYVRPSFLDLQGNQALIPMDKHTAGMPRTYLREEHRHLDEVIGDIVHDYINTRKVVVEGVRMAATSKKLVHGKTEVPTWIMDYGIVIDTDQANKLVETEKVERVNVREGLQFTLALPPTKPYSAKVKVVLEEMRDIIAASIITAKEPRSINFPEARKKSLTFR
jgi:8-oxo-dGTP pyrophosphatase MutT (NUDIX family)